MPIKNDYGQDVYAGTAITAGGPEVAGEANPGSWERFGSPAVNNVDERYMGHYRNAARAAQREELQAARNLFRNADKAVELQGRITQGETVGNIASSSRAGDALGQRRATMAGGRALASGAGDAISAAGGQRLQAVGGVMDAQGRTAQYEQAIYDDYMRRLVAMQNYSQRKAASDESEDAAQSAASAQFLRSMVGAISGAAGAAGAGTMGGGNSGGGGSGSYYNQNAAAAAQGGAYANAPGGYVNNSGMRSGSNYYNSAYDAYYGR